MKETRHGPRQSASNRFWIPLLVGLAVFIASRLAYENAFRLGGGALFHAAALLTGGIQFGSVVFAALVLYPVTYGRGAPAWERILAGSANLAVWLCIDIYNMTEAFPVGPSLYYGAGIGAVLFSWNLALIGGLELACRWAARKRGDRVRVLTPLPVVPLVVFAAVLGLLSREGGAAYFHTLLDGYRVVFTR